jgi:hypothetical protein
MLILAPSFFQCFDVSYQRFANCIKPVQLFLLLIDSLIQLLNQVFLKGDFCFETSATGRGMVVILAW